MNGPQHFIASERCLAEAIRKHSPLYMDAALVHAQLANAAVQAEAFSSNYDPIEEVKWGDAIKSAAKEAVPDMPIYDTMTSPAAAPLVPCPATAPDVPGVIRCTLAADHDGLHENGFYAMKWSAKEDLAAIEPEHQASCPVVFISSDSNHNCICTQAAGHVERGEPHICPECGAWTLASERKHQADEPARVRPYAANL